ncbi:hypothetical protein KL86DPRO_20501 [uncultured delta proteobacterium]|uniref:Uncharacterized protein n=1 Tax=uncultured delta proteobacterium TaxID=34034 RepID=A0A212K1N0_9DELT|nr:hypothetical protein KL86DPRO_20501 [uncultured delta proteobacterium]
MQSLLTKEQVAEYLAIKTPEAAEKLLSRLGVPKLDFSIIGGKGIRYRLADIEQALARVEVRPAPARRHRRRKPAPNIFDLPIKEQVAILTGKASKGEPR